MFLGNVYLPWIINNRNTFYPGSARSVEIFIRSGLIVSFGGKVSLSENSKKLKNNNDIKNKKEIKKEKEKEEEIDFEKLLNREDIISENFNKFFNSQKTKKWF